MSSFPYMAIAKKHGDDYGQVLDHAEFLLGCGVCRDEADLQRFIAQYDTPFRRDIGVALLNTWKARRAPHP